jgi:signal transduction histidine kinase
LRKAQDELLQFLAAKAYYSPMQVYLHWIDEAGNASQSFGPFEPKEGLQLSLGRSGDCDIVLTDKSVSREHASLCFHEENWHLEDLRSRYGSELDGNPVSESTPLKSASRIRLGRVLLEFSSNSKHNTQRPKEDRRFPVLLSILDILGRERSPAELMRSVISIAAKAVEADRGFLLLVDPDSGRWRPDSLASWNREGIGDLDEDAIGRVSQTVLREALDSGDTVFLRFAADDPRYESSESIRIESIQSVICCPLRVEDRRLGAFYIDRTHEGSHPFREDDRELLDTVSRQAALLLEREELVRARNRSDKLALLGTMLGRVTHELKNPLYNIRGTAENLGEKLRGGDLPREEVLARVDRILSGVDRAEENMRTLLGFVHPSEGPREPMDLARILTTAAVETGTLFQKSGIRLERNYEKGARVLGQSEALRQVFSNLLTNAAQALEEGGSVGISMSSERRLGASEDNWVEVIVSDNGPGIAEEDLGRIFDDFFTTKKGRGGSGLGLAICRQIVEEHRGEIRAENGAEGGAVFRVGLPLHS